MAQLVESLIQPVEIIGSKPVIRNFYLLLESTKMKDEILEKEAGNGLTNFLELKDLCFLKSSKSSL